MQTRKPEPPDPMEPFFTGTQADGGYWTDASRLSAHDHSGGLLGAPVAVTIPDGSITAADLDPSVLAPYALTDGSKPFTGQVTMQADAVVRDALLFGQQGSALAPDATLSRTSAGALRVDTHLGVGVNPAAWHANFRAVQVGGLGAVWSNPGAGGSEGIWLSSNTYFDGTAFRGLATNGEASYVQLELGDISFQTAPAVAAGGAQTFTQRARIATNGTLTLSPDAAANGVVLNTSGGGQLTLQHGSAAGNAVGMTSQNGPLQLYGLGAVSAWLDNLMTLGSASHRWSSVYAVAGTINTSQAQVKEAITPLDPGAVLRGRQGRAVVRVRLPAPGLHGAGAAPGHGLRRQRRQRDKGREEGASGTRPRRRPRRRSPRWWPRRPRPHQQRLRLPRG